MSFSITVYRNRRFWSGDPETYSARRIVSPVASSRYGVPPVVSTVTAPSNVTVTLIKAPIPYVPSSSGEETEETAGRTPSTTKASEPASVSAPDRPDRDSEAALAGLPAPSVIEPSLRDRAAGALL